MLIIPGVRTARWSGVVSPGPSGHMWSGVVSPDPSGGQVWSPRSIRSHVVRCGHPRSIRSHVVRCGHLGFIWSPQVHLVTCGHPSAYVSKWGHTNLSTTVNVKSANVLVLHSCLSPTEPPTEYHYNKVRKN